MGYISQSSGQSPRLPITQRIRQRQVPQQFCPITHDLLDPNHTTITVCGHKFDTNALDQWLSDHVTCPICRHIVRSIPDGASSLFNAPLRVRMPVFAGAMGDPELMGFDSFYDG
ncbi:MAG: RING finger domain-containing protein [Candidatus Marinamargulisbacteria bacterium]